MTKEKFCYRCGARLDERTGLCPNCDAAKSRQLSVKNAEISSGYRNSGKRKKGNKGSRRKIILIILLIFAAILAAFGAFVYFYPVPAPSLTSLMGERRDEDGSTVYSNGDYTYTPAKESLAYDEDSSVIYFNDQLIVYSFSEMSDEYASELAGMVNGEVVGKLSGSINALQISVKKSTLDELNAMAAQLMTQDNVLYAGYDYPVQLSPTEAKTDAKSEGMADSNPWSSDSNKADKNRGDENNPGGNDWWAEAIGAYTAWQYSNKCQPIKVGIIDNGFDANHEDLAGHISFLPDYSANRLDAGYIPSHGTHVAGIVGARNNDRGIRGIADSAELFCVDWSPDGSLVANTYISTGKYIEIIKQLVENGVKVINNSWGHCFMSKEGVRASTYDEDNSEKSEDNSEKSKENLITRAIETYAIDRYGTYDSYLKWCEAYSNRTALESTIMMLQLMLNGHNDFLIVQSAGNGEDNSGPGVDARNSAFFCAIDAEVYNEYLSEAVRNRLIQQGIDYNAVDERILIVGAVENKQNKNGYRMTKYSDFGQTVDICAPGGVGFIKSGKTIFSTTKESNYGGLFGTSMAAPMVSGSAALIWSLDPDLTATEVRNILLTNTSTQAYGVGDGAAYTYPMLNVGAAAEAVCGKTTSVTKKTYKAAYKADNIQPVRLQKYIGQNMMFRSWNTVGNSINEFYSGIRIAPEDEAAYPELKEALASFSEDMKISQQNRSYNEFETMKIKRSDAAAVSILTIDQVVVSETNSDTMDQYTGVNIDTKTGQSLALTDVITDLNSFTELVQSQFAAQWVNSGDGNGPDLDAFSTILRSDPSWTLEPDGITIYFDQYEFSNIAGQEVKTVKIPFRGNESIFSPEYIKAPVSYAYEVPMDCAFFSDVNQDGTIDRISISYSTSEDGYASTNIDVNGIETSAEAYWDEFLDPVLIHMENGSEYLMVERESEDSWVGEGDSDVFSLSGGTAVQQTSYPLAYYNCEYAETADPDISIFKEIPTNISAARFTIRTDMLGTSRAHSTYRIENSGEVVESEPWYTIDDSYQTTLTLLQPLTVRQVDEAAGTEIGDVTLETGEKVKPLRTDNYSYCDVLREDNTIVRIPSDTASEGCISTVNGIDVHSIFDGINEYS